MAGSPMAKGKFISTVIALRGAFTRIYGFAQLIIRGVYNTVYEAQSRKRAFMPPALDWSFRWITHRGCDLVS
jgi:hypothetical protein